MTEISPSDEELNALSGASDGEQEVPYIPAGESPYHTSFYRMLHRLLNVARRAGDLRVYKDGGLTFGVRAGRFANGSTAVDFPATAGQPLTDNAVNSIYLTEAGVLTVSTTGFPEPAAQPHIPLATIATLGGRYALSDIADCRGQAMCHVLSGLSAAAANTLCGGASADALHTHGAVGGNLAVAGSVTAGGAVDAAGGFSHNSTAGASNCDSGVATSITVSGGLVTDIGKTAPVPDGAYSFYTGGQSGNVASITVTGGIIVDIATEA